MVTGRTPSLLVRRYGVVTVPHRCTLGQVPCQPHGVPARGLVLPCGLGRFGAARSSAIRLQPHLASDWHPLGTFFLRGLPAWSQPVLWALSWRRRSGSHGASLPCPLGPCPLDWYGSYPKAYTAQWGAEHRVPLCACQRIGHDTPLSGSHFCHLCPTPASWPCFCHGGGFRPS